MGLGQRCIYECQHPLWGGDGACTQHAGSVDHDEQCLCDEGYLATDSFGSPSCVSRRGLVGCYLSVAMCGAAAVGFLQRTAMRQRRLSTAAQATRRARLRSGLLWWASGFSASTSICFCVAAAHGNLYTSGMLQMLYSVAMPVGALAVAYVLELWLHNLPSRFVRAESKAVKFMKLVEEKNTFVWMGGMAAISVASFGLVSFSSVLGVMTTVRAINLITGATAAFSVFCFVFVGFHLSRIIKTAKNKARPSARAFYEHATHVLRVQVGALSLVAILWDVAVVLLDPWMAGVGLCTPVIPLSIMVLDITIGFSLAVHFSMKGSATPPPALPCQAILADPARVTPTASSTGWGQRRMVPDVGAKAEERHGKLMASATIKPGKICPSGPLTHGNRAVLTLSEPREKRIIVPTLVDAC